MKPLRLLITNWTLAGRHGSVMYVRDLAVNLFRRGHHPVVYAPDHGEVARELRELTIPVAEHLGQIAAPPDVIIGNSHPDLMAALLHFPGVPGLFICHAWDTWIADPPRFPRLRRYVAVDETCRDWLVSEKGIPEERVRLVFNAVDLDRFQPRDPLPERPARAAVFSNYIGETLGLGILREACRRAGLTLDVMGEAGGQVVSRPEDVLRRYDLVFGKARCALEAMAVGCAVILCDYGKLGGFVHSQNWPELRRVNFGRRAIRHKLDVEHVLAEIGRYNARQAREVARCIRDVAGLGDAVEALLASCQEALAEQARAGVSDPVAELRAAGDYIAAMNQFKETLTFHGRIAREMAQAQLFREEVERLQADQALLQPALAATHTRLAALEERAQAIQASPLLRALGHCPGFRALALPGQAQQEKR